MIFISLLGRNPAWNYRVDAHCFIVLLKRVAKGWLLYCLRKELM
jgi:hypothetical protein